MARPLSPRILRPSSTLVPSRRTTRGTWRPSSLAAAMTPSAMTSHFMMPPKMLTKIAFTLGLRKIILKALVTCSWLAPPPTSRKFAGALDDVHRGHREARAVDEATDVAIERDVVEADLFGLNLDGIFFVLIEEV